MPKYGATHKDRNVKEFSRDFIIKEPPEQEYAKVIKVLGDCRFKLRCYDGMERIGHARGMLRKRKIMIDLNDILLVGLRTFEESKCDILMKYTPDEVRKLISMKAIIDTIPGANEVTEMTTTDAGEEDGGFSFEDI